MPADRAELVDLGDDEFTRGRPHPMIDNTPVCDRLREAVEQATACGGPPRTAVLLDCVIGHGSHADPAGALAAAVAGRLPGADSATVQCFCSVTGTDADPQSRVRQVETLEAAGIRVLPSNAAAARSVYSSSEQCRTA